MNHRVLRVMTAWSVCGVLLAGCGSSAVTTSQGHARSPVGLARHVLEVSASQNITELRVRATGVPRVAVTWIILNRQLRESLAPDGQPTLIQIAKHAYMRSAYQLVTRGKVVVRHNAACFAAMGTIWPKLAPDSLPPGAKIYRVSGNTVYFRSSAHTVGNAAAPAAHGYFRFNKLDLLTYDVIHNELRSGATLSTVATYSYPKAVPAKLVTAMPKNICKSKAGS